MTTIHEELTSTTFAGRQLHEVQAAVLLNHLGIDPDLPAEWATVDRCLDWLRDRSIWMESGNSSIDCWVGLYTGEGDEDVADLVLLQNRRAPTLHAALIAACQAVQEAS